ncbi:MAG: MBL fold metallo-hydrolase [Promethearchaeota archaeon]|jgi:glyoxylase-like metal-dependent hydrolase (beta-lactamase superfamily II)
MREVIKDVYHLGDSGCSVYLVNTQSEEGLVLIDCGMSISLIKRISKIHLNPLQINHCILTHFHIDHIAIANDLKNFNKKVKFYAHELDADPIEKRGYERETAARWYGVDYKPIKLHKKFTGDLEILKFGKYNLHCIHTPGHTPGSISVLIEVEGKRILFGQDLHGPMIPGVSNFGDYQISLRKLLELEADILCEGHFGIFQPASEVQRYINGFIDKNGRL